MVLINIGRGHDMIVQDAWIQPEDEFEERGSTVLGCNLPVDAFST